MRGYVLGLDAGRDLDDLWDHIAEESIDAADRVVGTLFDAFEALARNPGIGHKRGDLTDLPILFWPVGNYLVIYRAETSPSQIVAIVHGRRDIPAFLRKRPNLESQARNSKQSGLSTSAPWDPPVPPTR